MAVELGCSPSQIQLTVTLFLACYALSQVFIGGLLDAWERHKLTLYSLIFLVISGIILGFLSNIYLIYLFRDLQGLCAGVAASGKRSFFIELLFSGETIVHRHSLKINQMVKSYSDVLKTADFRYGLILLSLPMG